MRTEASNHVWRFFRAGGTDQVHLETAEDMLDLSNLDQKLWVALCCPTKDLECDTKTLELLDTDHDGRVRVPEILAAIQWTGANLKDLAAIKNGADALPLSAINDTTEEGQQLRAAAKQILINLGKPEATASHSRAQSLRSRIRRPLGERIILQCRRDGSVPIGPH